ncbi:PREDICTED: stress response protein nst1-like [Acropora digitifera]|uniref:stress response protein nst1-like n=1 Tax=Acropora digitifera TaxID=70779 RepID=UPI00077B2026|nr:PREDICTED: stress response protein nst1-like [Acropora digitifera]
MYQELVNKGLSESEKEAILERLMAEVDMQQGAREDERRRQKEIVERKLEKKREMLEKKMREEQLQQAKIRNQEDGIVGDLIVNQVAMSEEERDRIIQEHEKNLAELESSFTLSKLRQRQMLEEKLSERRKRKMAQLEQRQAQEVRVRQLKLHLVPSWRQYLF